MIQARWLTGTRKKKSPSVLLGLAQFVEATACRTQHRVLVPVAGPDQVTLHAIDVVV